LQAAEASGDGEMSAVARLSVQRASDEVELADELQNRLLGHAAGVQNGFGHPESVFDDPGTVASLQRLAHSSLPVGSVDLGPICSAEQVVSMIETGAWGPRTLAAGPDTDIPGTARVAPPYGLVSQLRRPPSVLDLMPVQTMEGASFTFTQEGGAWTAAEAAEGSIKPSGDITLTDQTVTAETIAAYLRLKRQQIADVPSLSVVVQQRLIYSVMRRLEGQVLSGTGVAPNLQGILSTTGIAAVAYVATTPLTDLVNSGITSVLLSEATPNGVVLNPQDLQTMLTVKTSGSGERLDSDGAFATPPTSIWGLPAIPSTAIPVGQALVGDFALGATLFVREGVNLRMSDSDQDAFVRNEVVLLAEGRWGLAIWRPACFALVHLA
jgi:hypothetical protein